MPKTGGTTIQDVLLPFSDDGKYLLPFQDGIDSFEVKGPVTPGKHATLQDYYDLLGGDLDSYRVVVSVRHPLNRAVSGYFSPHKWAVRQQDGSWQVQDPFWEEARFEDLLNMPNHMPATDYLRVNGAIRRPDIIIRHERFLTDFQACLDHLGVPGGSGHTIPQRNASAAKSGLFRAVQQRPEVHERVERKYAADLEYFGYPPCAALFA
ncbi:sulfotransferase family 2 domain-containing protein [Leisingera aquaemixtae]|uniref:sulfotransferase family 2 domain-containing protein n=1 Tax=Leisingera aquaemixtae TaxID=1396826 RepID=UPI0028F6FF06|nr:sulfotransferase family 2 domain-containing protein [Leisingera aquaemixtae]